MNKKIIELTKYNGGFTCLLCCDNEATIKVTVNRVKYDDSVTAFHICDKCLTRMQNDIQKICEQQVFCVRSVIVNFLRITIQND